MSKTTKIRDSNFELLRLTTMLFILLHHFIIHGLRTTGYFEDDNISNVGVILNSHVMIGVHCFTLISGYFSIKATFRGFLRLYLICFFYKMGLNLFSILNSGVFSIKSIISPFFPISHGLGFITTYIYLYLLSPLLNHFINKVNKKEYTIILLIFAMLTFYYGFLFKGAINPDGYNNIMNFIFLYLIGRYIALYTTSDTGSWNKKILYAVIFSACSFLIAGSVIIICKLNLNKTWISSWSYPLNSPLVMISSIAFFLFFRTLKIKSKLINWLACSVLSIFLIHENPVIKDTIYQYVNETGKQISNGFLLAGYLFILAIGIMIICIFIDKIRIFIMNPVERMIGKINVEKYMNIMIDKIENIIK